MLITICGSMKFFDQMQEAEKELKSMGHDVLIPLKKGFKIKNIAESKLGHMDKINKSDAILVINTTNKNIENRIGGSTFLEIGVAHYKRKKIFLLNPIPEQPYIIDELNIVEPQVINGDYSKIV